MKKKLVFAFAITLLVNQLPTTTVQPMSSPAAASPEASPASSDNEGSGVTPNRSSSRSSSSSDSDSESNSNTDSENIEDDIVDDIAGCNAAAVAEHLEKGFEVSDLFQTILKQLEAVNEECNGDKERLEQEQGTYCRLLLQLMTDHNVDLSLPAGSPDFAELADAGGFLIIAQLLDLIADSETVRSATETIAQLTQDLAATRKALEALQKPQTRTLSATAARSSLLGRLLGWLVRTK